ncbi:zinc-dependent alcohol dehydrogenase family protein [Azospirillum canadense]|uniref:zinc-dependent alcohol dehydrogenase family protein n=1 Tax=Azospirillum canadense TaxID=403962 RepID=UPI002227302F|nr:NAD(P)-dependent alcohol dehydrogenase [Azospirillum canadense]MCW2241901.1 NADPH:quinone reductase-like Zn-dependent oxidoreductase [Azospirillum canadense]
MRVMEIRGDWSVDHIVEAQRPEPAPGPTQVLLRMKAATLNYRDHVLVRRGYGSRSGELPLVPVSDGVGEVVAVGAAVTRFKVGDRVCPTFFQDWVSGPFRDGWWRSQLGGPRDGVMQEFMAVEQHAAVRVPGFLTDLEAAALPCAGVTAWSAVVAQNPVKAGDVVVVQGTGGVSLFALQFAKMQGARVIALSSSDAKLERARALGADELVNYRADPEWGRTVRRLTDGVGADHVVEVGGAGTLAQSVRAVRGGGTISLIGVLGGAAAEFGLGHVVTQNIRLQGVTVGSRDLFEDMLRAIDLHGMRPVVDEKLYAFQDVADAIRRLPEGGHVGKVGVVFDTPDPASR